MWEAPPANPCLCVTCQAKAALAMWKQMPPEKKRGCVLVHNASVRRILVRPKLVSHISGQSGESGDWAQALDHHPLGNVMKKALAFGEKPKVDGQVFIAPQRLAVVPLPPKPDTNWGWRGHFSYGDTKVGDCAFREGGVFSFISVDCGLRVGDREVKDFLDEPQTTVEVVNCTDEPVQVKVFEPVSHAATRLFRSPLAEGTISPGTNRVYTVKASKDADTHLDVEIRIGNKKAKCEVVGDQVIFVDGLMDVCCRFAPQNMAITLEAECSLTHEGDVVCLIGSGEVLGRWNVNNAVLLQTGPQLFPRWRAVLPLAASGAECKLIIKRKGGSVDWEPGDNRSFPSTQFAATVRMSYGRKEMDLIPESGQNGYPAVWRLKSKEGIRHQAYLRTIAHGDEPITNTAVAVTMWAATWHQFITLVDPVMRLHLPCICSFVHHMLSASVQLMGATTAGHDDYLQQGRVASEIAAELDRGCILEELRSQSPRIAQFRADMDEIRANNFDRVLGALWQLVQRTSMRTESWLPDLVASAMTTPSVIMAHGSTSAVPSMPDEKWQTFRDELSRLLPRPPAKTIRLPSRVKVGLQNEDMATDRRGLGLGTIANDLPAHQVGGRILQTGGYRSAHLYFGSAKKEHILQFGSLSRTSRFSSMDMIRSIERGQGPSKLKDSFSWRDLATIDLTVEDEQFRIHYNMVVLGCFFLTREIELSATLRRHIRLDEEKRTVSWTLPATKTCTKGELTERTHKCMCKSVPCQMCPFHCMEDTLLLTHEAWEHTDDGPLFLRGYDHMTKAYTIEAIRKVLQTAEIQTQRQGAEGMVERFHGHCLRISGSQALVRMGFSTTLIMLLAREATPSFAASKTPPCKSSLTLMPQPYHELKKLKTDPKWVKETLSALSQKCDTLASEVASSTRHRREAPPSQGGLRHLDQRELGSIHIRGPTSPLPTAPQNTVSGSAPATAKQPPKELPPDILRDLLAKYEDPQREFPQRMLLEPPKCSPGYGGRWRTRSTLRLEAIDWALILLRMGSD
eukprot:s565_g12.t1